MKCHPERSSRGFVARGEVEGSAVLQDANAENPYGTNKPQILPFDFAQGRLSALARFAQDDTSVDIADFEKRGATTSRRTLKLYVDTT
jgi:hypothetical protein